MKNLTKTAQSANNGTTVGLKTYTMDYRKFYITRGQWGKCVGSYKDWRVWAWSKKPMRERGYFEILPDNKILVVAENAREARAMAWEIASDKLGFSYPIMTHSRVKKLVGGAVCNL